MYLLSKLNINLDNPIPRHVNNDIEKILFEVSKNEESFISSCELYFKFIKPKEIQLPTAHELGGFTCSFDSGRRCQYCLIHHKDMKHVYRESDVLIRTTASHDFHVKHIENVPSDKSLYGVNEKSILSILS
ncbi:unnamed protein product, partial [Adineta steineri]